MSCQTEELSGPFIKQGAGGCRLRQATLQAAPGKEQGFPLETGRCVCAGKAKPGGLQASRAARPAGLGTAEWAGTAADPAPLGDGAPTLLKGLLVSDSLHLCNWLSSSQKPSSRCSDFLQRDSVSGCPMTGIRRDAFRPTRMALCTLGVWKGWEDTCSVPRITKTDGSICQVEHAVVQPVSYQPGVSPMACTCQMKCWAVRAQHNTWDCRSVEGSSQPDHRLPVLSPPSSER